MIHIHSRYQSIASSRTVLQDAFLNRLVSSLSRVASFRLSLGSGPRDGSTLVNTAASVTMDPRGLRVVFTDSSASFIGKSEVNDLHPVTGRPPEIATVEADFVAGTCKILNQTNIHTARFPDSLVPRRTVYI